MVHNGVEYGIMAAYGEGLNILAHANAGRKGQEIDAETTPVRDPWAYQYDFDLAEVAEVWRRGSVVASWLLDLTADAVARSPQFDEFAGRVSDSGEGRWTVLAAVDTGHPRPCSLAPSSIGSPHVAKRTSRTSFFPPCAPSSGDIKRGGPRPRRSQMRRGSIFLPPPGPRRTFCGATVSRVAPS